MESSALILMLVNFIIIIPLNALILMFIIKQFKQPDDSFLSAIKYTGIIGIMQLIVVFIMDFYITQQLDIPGLALIGVLSIVGFVLSNIIEILLFKFLYSFDWKNTLLIFIVWSIAVAISGNIVSLITGAINSLVTGTI